MYMYICKKMHFIIMDERDSHFVFYKTAQKAEQKKLSACKHNECWLTSSRNLTETEQEAHLNWQL